MDEGWNMGLRRDPEPSADERLEMLHSTLKMHRELIEQKAEIREQPDDLTARLEAMTEEVDLDDDAVSDAVRLLLEAEKARGMQFDELDRRLDQLTESFMVGSITLLERLRPPGI